MLDATMTQQLGTYLANLREPIELVASLGDDPKSAQTRELLEEIAALHDMVSASFDGDDARKPSFIIRRAADATKWVRFAGLPMGHEFTSLVLALLWAGGHPPKVEDEVLEQITALEGEHDFEMYFSLSCHNCPGRPRWRDPDHGDHLRRRGPQCHRADPQDQGCAVRPQQPRPGLPGGMGRGFGHPGPVA